MTKHLKRVLLGLIGRQSIVMTAICVLRKTFVKVEGVLGRRMCVNHLIHSLVVSRLHSVLVMEIVGIL